MKIYTQDEVHARLREEGFTFVRSSAEWTSRSFTGRLCHAPNPNDLNDAYSGPRWWLQSTDYRRYSVVG